LNLRSEGFDLGNDSASIDSLVALTNSNQEHELGGLRKADLDGKDKMNFKAFDRITAPCIQQILIQKGCLAAATYIEFARNSVIAFTDPSLTPEERIKCAFFALYFSQGWALKIEQKAELRKKEVAVRSTAKRKVKAGIAFSNKKMQVNNNQ
jgi:hypothetical protein